MILANSKSELEVGNLLQDVYKNVVLKEAAVRQDGDYKDKAGTNPVTNVAINTVSTGGDESQHVGVSRAPDGNLKLSAFQTSRRIDYSPLDRIAEKTASALWPAFGSDDVAVTDGPDFATASLGIGNVLNVIAWNFNGAQFTQHASAFGPAAKEVAATKVAASGLVTRVVTAVRGLDNKLRLDVWDLTNVTGAPQFSAITHQSMFVDNLAEAIEIKSLRTTADFSQPARFVTAYRASTGELLVKAWEVAPNGKLTPLDSQGFGAGTPVSSDSQVPHRVAIDAAGDGRSRFFNGKGFMTTFIGESLLHVVTWQLDDLGKIILKDSAQTGGAVKEQALSATTTVATLPDDPATNSDESGKVKLIKWAVADDGTITRSWSSQPNIKAARVAATGNLVAAFVQLDPANTLRVANWVTLDPQ